MLAKLLTLFILIPIVELALLLFIGDVAHWSVSIGLIVGSGFIGALLVRWQGRQALGRIRAELSQGRQPTESLWDAGMIFIAGALMLTPGVLTDVFGMTLLIPPCRRFYQRQFVAMLKRRFGIPELAPPNSAGRAEIIDTYVVGSEDDPNVGNSSDSPGP